MKSKEPKEKTQKQRTGSLGEDAAARHYESEGYTVVERNYRVSHKEIDLIVANATHIVFVEVKTRHAVYGARSRFGRPADAVDQDKRSNIVAAAKYYLKSHPTRRQPRIDVVEVYVSTDADGRDFVQKVLAFRNAFGAR